MVFVNDRKYACETCIKGHRSSTCNHTQRPLFEIKKKGRPVTQCEHCRQLRKTKQIHVKCLCEGKDDVEAQSICHSIPAKKANRKNTVVNAAFPDGLKDTSEAPTSSSGPMLAEKADQRIGLPCHCKVGETCSCCTPRLSTKSSKGGYEVDQHREAPARVSSPSKQKNERGKITANRNRYSPDSAARGVCSGTKLAPEQCGPVHDPSSGTPHGHGVRQTHGTSLYTPYGLAHEHVHGSIQHNSSYASTQPEPEAILRDAASSVESFIGSLQASPDPSTDWSCGLPPNLFDTLCECGDSCACPGCVVHRGASAFTSPTSPAESCANPSSCGSCLNCTILTLPPLTSNEMPANPTLAYDPSQFASVDDWLCQASAAVSAPSLLSPLLRTQYAPLDPASYSAPPTFWANNQVAPNRAQYDHYDQRECCGGRCSCQMGQCACQDDCCGCCQGCECLRDDAMQQDNSLSYAVSGERGPCCSGKHSSQRASYDGGGSSSNPASDNTAFQASRASLLTNSMFGTMSLSTNDPSLSRSSSSGSQSSGRSGRSGSSKDSTSHSSAIPSVRSILPKGVWPVPAPISPYSLPNLTGSSTSSLGITNVGSKRTSPTSHDFYYDQSYLKK